MPTPPFKYQELFPLSSDTTEYYLLTKDHVSVTQFDSTEVLKVEPEALTKLTNAALHDCSFLLRTAHQQQVAAILDDPQASENDKYVALTMLRNAEIAAKGILPFCSSSHISAIDSLNPPPQSSTLSPTNLTFHTRCGIDNASCVSNGNFCTICPKTLFIPSIPAKPPVRFLDLFTC